MKKIKNYSIRLKLGNSNFFFSNHLARNTKTNKDCLVKIVSKNEIDSINSLSSILFEITSFYLENSKNEESLLEVNDTVQSPNNYYIIVINFFIDDLE